MTMSSTPLPAFGTATTLSLAPLRSLSLKSAPSPFQIPPFCAHFGSPPPATLPDDPKPPLHNGVQPHLHTCHAAPVAL